MTRVMRLASISLLVGMVVLGLKCVAYVMTGSVALYSDALESIVNVAAAGMAMLAVWFAQRPADEDHPWGHHKAEYFAAGLEGALIVLAALLIVHEAWDAYFNPREITFTLVALGINALAGLMNAGWGWKLISVGREEHSPALVADGRHLMADVVSSAGVLSGVVLAVMTGWEWLDPMLAGCVAVSVVWSGLRLLRESFGGLMDEAVEAATLAKIERVIAKEVVAARGAVLEAHDVRTRRAGKVVFVEFHLVVRGAMTVRAAHTLCDRFEERIGKAVKGAKVTVHVEPEEKAKKQRR